MSYYDFYSNSDSDGYNDFVEEMSNGALDETFNLGNIGFNFNADNPEIMSSDFFDAALSLQHNLPDEEDWDNDPALQRVHVRVADLDEESSNAEETDDFEMHDYVKREKKETANFSDDGLNSSESSNVSHVEEVFSPESLCSEIIRQAELENEKQEPAVLQEVKRDYIISNIFKGKDAPPPPATKEPETPSKIVQIQKPTTKLMIQNPTNRKLIVKQVTSATPLKRAFNATQKMKPQVLRVQTLPRDSVYLPLNVKSFKILNSSDIQAEPVTVGPQFKRRKIHSGPVSTSSISDSLEDEDVDIVSSSQLDNRYNKPLNLTNEEKRLLAKEGIQLPTHYPLTKHEERDLKRIRRKIRNKISAQDSRKRKKEYVDGLEERVKRSSEEKKFLLQHIQLLEKQNTKLTAQLSKLQSLIFNGSTTKAAPTTCLMIVLLSALLVSLPNIRLPENNKQLSTDKEQIAIRRALLSSQQATEDDVLNMEEFLVFNREDDPEYEKFGDDVDMENITDKDFSKLLEDIGLQYNGNHRDKNSSQKETLFRKLLNNVKNFLNERTYFGSKEYGGYKNNKGFIEPDVDDLFDDTNILPAKRMKVNLDDLGPVQNEINSVSSSEVTASKSVIISNSKGK